MVRRSVSPPAVLAALLVLASVIPAAGVRAESTSAFAGDAAAGRGALLWAFEHAAALPMGAIPIPVLRPSLRLELTGGLDGPLDLRFDGHIGGLAGIIYRASGGLRLAPLTGSSRARPAMVLLGGIRSIPGGPSAESPCFGCSYTSSHPAVALAGVDGVFEIQGREGASSFLLRVRYETHWIAIEDRTHGRQEEVRVHPQFASQMWELRLGALTRPTATYSGFFEIGVYVYAPALESELSTHAGLMMALGGALAPEPLIPSPPGGPTPWD